MQTEKVEAVLVRIDAEKASDSVRWKFLYDVLQKLGFHETIIKTIQALYDKTSAKIKVNRDLSNPLILERGCQQGCAVCRLLFAVFTEPLSQWIKQNNNIKGVEWAGGEHKTVLFVDDVLIYLTQPTQSFLELMSALKCTDHSLVTN